MNPINMLFKRDDSGVAPIVPAKPENIPTVDEHLHPFFHTEIYKYVQEMTKPYRRMCRAAYMKARLKVALLILFVLMLISGENAMIVTAIQSRSRDRAAGEVDAATSAEIDKVMKEYDVAIKNAGAQYNRYAAQAGEMQRANKAAFDRAIAEGKPTSSVKPYDDKLDAANANAERAAAARIALVRERDEKIDKLLAAARDKARLDVETVGLYLLGIILPWAVFLCQLRAATLRRDGRDGAMMFIVAGWIGQVVSAYFINDFGVRLFKDLNFVIDGMKINPVGLALAVVVVFLYTRTYESVAAMILEMIDQREKEVFRARDSMRNEIAYRRSIIVDVVDYGKMIDAEHRRLLASRYDVRREIDKAMTQAQAESIKNEREVMNTQKALEIDSLVPRAATPADLARKLYEMEIGGTLVNLKNAGITLVDVARRNGFVKEQYNSMNAMLSYFRKEKNGKTDEVEHVAA